MIRKLAVLLLFLPGACAWLPEQRLAPSASTLQSVGVAEGFELEEISVGTLRVPALVRMRTPGDGDVVFYLDGEAWSPHVPAEPASGSTLLANLAFQDAAANVVYIPHPCSLQPQRKTRPCHLSEDWTQGWFSDQFVQAYEKVLEYPAFGRSYRKHLVGTMGAGVISQRLAHNRQDIASVRTLHSDIEHLLESTRPPAPSLDELLSSKSYQWRKRRIPQHHYISAAQVANIRFADEQVIGKLDAEPCSRVVRPKDDLPAHGPEVAAELHRVPGC